MFVNKNILVTGATGFVGYHLVKRLTQDNNVYCIVRKNSKLAKLEKLTKIQFIYYEGNLTSLLSQLQGINIDLTYHLASLFIAEHKSDQIDDLIDSNIKFPTHLLEALTLLGKTSLVNTGTAWQNYTDNDYDPVCLYAATKECFENIIKYYHEAHKLNCITLRLYDTYGPEDERKKLFYLLNDLKVTGRELDMSPGEQKLNLVYIDDVIDAFLLAGERILTSLTTINEVYGIYVDEEYTLREVVHSYEQVNKCKLNINWGKRAYRTREVMHPVYKFSRLAGWQPTFSLIDGLQTYSAYCTD
jgi:nucleoside-diphosphate-sugar epimerase